MPGYFIFAIGMSALGNKQTYALQDCASPPPQRPDNATD